MINDVLISLCHDIMLATVFLLPICSLYPHRGNHASESLTGSMVESNRLSVVFPN